MELGNRKENLTLKTAGKLQVLWGNKFIDLLDKNGNLNIKHLKILQPIESKDDLKKDGIYVLDDDIIIFFNGKIVTTISNSLQEDNESSDDSDEEDMGEVITTLQDFIEQLDEKLNGVINTLTIIESKIEQLEEAVFGSSSS